MLIVSTENNKKIPYHNKVINTVKNYIINIDPELMNFNWIVSGSFAVNALYSPKKVHNDIDFYFPTEEDYLKCFAYLQNKYQFNFYQSDFADTFPNNIQLVKKWFLPPEQLIMTHDFVNVSVAITNTSIYTTKETHFAWYNDELDLRNFQIAKDPPATSYEKLVALNLLLARTNKYLERYELNLSPSFKKFLYEQQTFLNSIDENTFAQDQPVILNYYGRPVNYFSQISSTIFLIKQVLNIFDEEMTDINYI